MSLREITPYQSELKGCFIFWKIVINLGTFMMDSFYIFIVLMMYMLFADSLHT